MVKSSGKNSDKKQELHMSLAWWSDIIRTLDSKVHGMSKVGAYGSISLEIVIQNGKTKDIVFSDKLKLRQKTQKEAENKA